MRNLGHWVLAAACLAMAPFVQAQTEDQEYRIINSMTADTGQSTPRTPGGDTVSCAPADTYIRHHCAHLSVATRTDIGYGFSYPCVGQSIYFYVEDTEATVSWQCGSGMDQHITVTGTISRCSDRHSMSYTVTCP